MNHQQIVTHLSVNGDVFKYLFKNLSEEQARWKSCAERWSLLEVINHLYDDGNQARIHLSRSQFDSDNDFFCSTTRVVTTPNPR
jgi:hypothetical protein